MSYIFSGVVKRGHTIQRNMSSNFRTKWQVISQRFEVNNQRKAGKHPNATVTHHSMTLWEPNASQSSATIVFSDFTSDMKNSTDYHLCHRLFRSGNRGALECDRRKQSLRKCALQVGNGDTDCQAGQWLKFFGTQNRGKTTGTPQIPANRSGNSLWLWLVCVRYDACWMTCILQCTWWSVETQRGSLDNIVFNNG